MTKKCRCKSDQTNANVISQVFLVLSAAHLSCYVNHKLFMLRNVPQLKRKKKARKKKKQSWPASLNRNLFWGICLLYFLSFLLLFFFYFSCPSFFLPFLPSFSFFSFSPPLSSSRYIKFIPFTSPIKLLCTSLRSGHSFIQKNNCNV